MDIMEHIYDKAKKNPQRVTFPEATEEKILRAAHEVDSRGLGIPILVGDPIAILEAMKKFGIPEDRMKIYDSSSGQAQDTLIEEYLLEHKALSYKSLKRRCADPLYVALMLEAVGQADCTFAGLTHTTGDVILAGQTIIGLKNGVSTVSSMGIFDIPGYEGSEGSLLAFGDSAVCTAPSSKELAGIAISACDTVSALLDWDARCALLSFSTDGSAEHPYVDLIRQAVETAHTLRPDLKIDGELQLDAAINPTIAAKKMHRESKVAGKANIIIWPDLNVGNIGVKLVQYFAGANAYGPMLQGFSKIVCDCSRGAPLSELVGNIAISLVRAQSENH